MFHIPLTAARRITYAPFMPIDNDVPLPLDEARASLQRAIADLEKSAFHFGYDHGFNAGWDAAVRRFSAMTAEKPDPAVPSLGDMDTSAKDVILRIVQTNPGLRGTEIVAASGVLGAPINERTTRTALHRLKLAGIIRNDDGRWYAVGAEAAA